MQYDYDMAFDSDAEEEADGFGSPNVGIPSATASALPITTTTTTTTTTTQIDLMQAECSLTMFDKTYLRGDSATLVNPHNSTVSDLSQISFDDRLASLEVVGPCCWTLFENSNFTGQNKAFAEGQYKSSTHLGSALTREVSSVLITTC